MRDPLCCTSWRTDNNVRYSRMLRAKDLANYSSEDKSAIFGGVPQGTSNSQEVPVAGDKKCEPAAQMDVGSESEVRCFGEETSWMSDLMLGGAM